MQSKPYNELTDIEAVTLCIWREARGETITGQRGVGHVIRNRSIIPAWWNHHRANDLAAVVLYPYQFSSFNPGDPNEKLWPADDDPIAAQCQAIAGVIVAGTDNDLTNGATYYYDMSIEFPAGWGSPADYIQTIDIGRLKFFRFQPPTGPQVFLDTE